MGGVGWRKGGRKEVEKAIGDLLHAVSSFLSFILFHLNTESVLEHVLYDRASAHLDMRYGSYSL